MKSTTSRNTSGKFWMAVTILFALLQLASAQSGHNRIARENTLNVHDTFSKMGENGIAEQVNAEISGTIRNRQKRLSDQRRAELETLIALSKMTGKLMNVIRGGRQLQAIKTTDRKKRSVFDLNVKNLQKLFRLSQKLGYKGNSAYPIVS
ncbi:uncharacterized protein LOC122528937 [Frieseomelitta varia]|uniref:uncharacterized protein LOC122528937 n=1 Tax=Frieseomelitta varia TaxID=561572 RepID=UPI001CB6847C|nr:uncharacterized protein LOC122528937 [Frieseomelitta varia]